MTKCLKKEETVDQFPKKNKIYFDIDIKDDDEVKRLRINTAETKMSSKGASGYSGNNKKPVEFKTLIAKARRKGKEADQRQI